MIDNADRAAARRGDYGTLPCRLVAWGCILLAIVVCASVPRPAFAVPCALPQWTADVSAAAAIASMPVFDTLISPVPGRSLAYVTQGTQLFRFYNQNFPLGCTPVPGSGGLCTPNGSGNTCSRIKGCKLPPWPPVPLSPLHSPNVVRLSRTGIPFPLKVFLTAGDGRLYKIDVTGDSMAEPTISADTRRPSCFSDQVIATPAVQLYASSNSTFKNEVDSYGPSHSQDDVVIVITKTGCGDQTRNRVIAYWASDLTVKWTFNGPALPGQETGPTRLGGSTGGCSLDYENNRLYCGTDAPDGSTQDTVWALNTVNGALLWSDNPGGAVLNRPILNNHNKRLYVVSRSGALWAYAPGGNGLGGPSRLWTTGLAVASSGAIVTHSPWVEERAGTWQDKILVLDSLGTLHAVSDNGAGGSILWVREPTDTAQWVSAPVVLPGASESKGFIGRDDGYLQMIKLEGGQVQGIIQVAATVTEDVYDPAIEQDPSAGQAVVVVGGKKIARIGVPICTDDPTAGTNSCYDECFLPGEADGLSPPNWNPSCLDPDHSCWSYSCRNPAQNPKYNPCRALTAPTTACHNSDYPSCFLGGDGCVDQGNVPDGLACDDGWPGSPDPVDGAVTCRADAIPALAACTLAEGQDCNPQTGTSQPGSRFKCVTKPQVCGSIGGGKCCVCDDGFGMNCNDRCERGQCVSDLYVGCAGGNSACIDAGDRACPSGSTCCGSNKGSVCTTDAGCTASLQGRCVDPDPLDGNATKFCYYQQCADLGADPQHCGACGNDCGEYTISAASCSDDLGCGSCTSDAQCAVFGGKCVDGACGICRGNTSASGQPICGAACATDATCGGGNICTNGFCCGAGRECVAGACLPLVCHRLVQHGACANGVCSPGSACLGPDRDDLETAHPQGMCSLDFEFRTDASGNSVCRGYATNYVTSGGNKLARIDESGTPFFYTSADATPLNGVAVPRDGSQIFGAMVNDGGTPGLALSPPGTSSYSRVKTATATGGVDDNPFDQVAFDKGPVGPAFDDMTFTNDTSRKTWFGNFKCPAPPDGTCACVDAGLCRVDFQTGMWTAVPETYCNQPCADADGLCEYTLASSCAGPSQRITALALERRPSGDPGVFHRSLMVAHGTLLSFVDLDGGSPRQADVNLASPAAYTPDPARGESTIEAILSIAALPYGEAILEVRGAGDNPAPGNVKNTWLVNVSAHDRSCRHERDVQRGVKHVNPCGPGSTCPAGLACVDQVCMKSCGACPAGFTCFGGACRIASEVPMNFGLGAGPNAGNGRLAVLPSGNLLRWIAAVDADPRPFTEYDLSASGTGGGVSCDDGIPCTADLYDFGTAQCVHPPIDCADADPCTIDSCDPPTGSCLYAPIVLSEPGPVQLPSTTVLQWPPTGDATLWNTYRGTIPQNCLGSRLPGTVYDQVCHESDDAFGDGATTSTDAAIPPVGTAYYYFVSGEAGCESVLGHASSGAPVPNTSPCPTPP